MRKLWIITTRYIPLNNVVSLADKSRSNDDIEESKAGSLPIEIQMNWLCLHAYIVDTCMHYTSVNRPFSCCLEMHIHCTCKNIILIHCSNYTCTYVTFIQRRLACHWFRTDYHLGWGYFFSRCFTYVWWNYSTLVLTAWGSSGFFMNSWFCRAWKCFRCKYHIRNCCYVFLCKQLHVL